MASQKDSKPQIYRQDHIDEIDLPSHIRNYQDLFSRFWIFRDHYRQVQQVFDPYAGRNLWGLRDPYEDLGVRRDQFRLSIRPFLAKRALIDLFSEGLTPEDRPCIALEFEDEDLMNDEEVKTWLWRTRNVILRAFQNGGFYDQAKVLYGELPTFGSANMVIYDDATEGAVYKTDTIGEFIFGLGKYNSIATTYRRKIMTLGQIEEEFGRDSMTKTMLQLLDRKIKNSQWMMVNAISPAKYFDPNGRGKAGMDYDNFWFIDGEVSGSKQDSNGGLSFNLGSSMAGGENTVLRSERTSGKPNLTPRWQVRGGEIYGISPVMECLNGIKFLQKERSLHLRALNKTIDPAKWIPADLRSYNIKNQPGANNYYPSHIKPDAIFQEEAINYNIKDVVEDMASLAAEIDECLYKDVSMAMRSLSERQPDSTAYLASKVWEEAMRKIGPVVNMLKRDFFKPAIDRTFEICLNHGLIQAPPPQVPWGTEIKIKYTSLLARSMEVIGDLNALQSSLSINTQLSQLNPKAAFIFDPYAVQSMANEGYNLNPKLIIPKDQYEAMCQQMDKAQQMQQEMAMAEQGAGAAQKLGDTQVGGKSVLDHLTGK